MHEVDSSISRSLEDYLETIYRLLGSDAVARVGDIAMEMEVSPASVTPAMKRLAEMGLVDYSKRRHVRLTDEGISVARRTLVRHNILFRFLVEVLGIDEELADRDACSMEHSLSSEALLRLATLFEVMAVCPGFDNLVHSGLENWEDGRLPLLTDPCTETPPSCPFILTEEHMVGTDFSRLSDQPIGEACRIGKVTGPVSSRAILIDRGFVEGAILTILRPLTGDLPCIIELDGYRMELDGDLTDCIMVRPMPVEGIGS